MALDCRGESVPKGAVLTSHGSADNECQVTRLARLVVSTGW